MNFLNQHTLLISYKQELLETIKIFTMNKMKSRLAGMKQKKKSGAQVLFFV